jgi:hypothetical protein
MSSIPINYTFTETATITSMKIEITQLILFSSCQFRVTFFNQDGELVKSQILNMSGADYQGWTGCNDEYAIVFIKNQLGIS